MKVLKYFLIFLMITVIGGSFSFFHKPREKQCDAIYEIIEAEELKEVICPSEEEFVFDFEEAISGMTVRTLDDSELNGHLNVSYNEAVVVAEGKVFEGHANINGGILIVYGTFTPKHFNFNDGRLVILRDGKLKNVNINDEIENYGELVIEELNINSNGILVNYGTLEINDNFNNNSAFINNKETYINGHVNNNRDGEIENNSKLIINGRMINNSRIINNNEIIIYFDLFNNGSGEIKNNGILSVGGEIKNYGKIEGNEIYDDFKRVEAERMKLDNCKVERWYYASGGKVIRAYRSNAKAEYRFKGDAGNYVINVRYLDRKDKETTFKLYVDDNMISEWEDNESVDKNFFRIKTIENVYIKDGSKVILRLEGDRHSGAIVDYIEFEDICGTISGGFTIQEEDDVKYVNMLNDATTDIKLVNTVKEDCILWMKGKLIYAEDMDIYVNDKKLAVRDNLYYFKWLKLGEFSNNEDVSIRIVNKNALVNIDKFYFTRTDIAPFAGEYVIDDILADIENEDNVKILFSGENLKNADVTLYRKMTAESYYQYLKDKYGWISKHELISKVLYFFKKNNPEVICTKKIIDISEYSMLDDDPVDGYECEYFLRIDNCFGESLYSKRIFVLYEKEDNNISFRYDHIDKFDDKYEKNDDGYKKKRFEAENMKFKGFKYHNKKGASKGKALQSKDNNFEAWFNFDGDDGTYYFKVRYLYSKDDDSQCSIYINNKKIDEWFNKNVGNYNKYKERDIKEIKLKKGDRISFKGKWSRRRKGYFIFDCIDIIGKDKFLKDKNIYGFKRDKDEVKYEPGFVVRTDTDERLYLNKHSKIKEIPSFLKDSYFYRGLKDLENVAFHANKFTDVFVYVPDKDRSYTDYYYSKGFKLIKVPVELSSSTGDDFTYFYHKRYRAGTGDSLYLVNPKKIEENTKNSNFSIYVDRDDLIVYFNTEDTLLEDSEKIYIRYPVNFPEKNKGHPWGRRYLYHKKRLKKMRKIGENLWVYRIKYGADHYDKLDFEFFNRHHITESNPDWIWDKDIYLQELAKKASCVVFFKELELDNYDVNFSNRYQSQYIGFEDYLLDDGTVYAARGKELVYGLTHELPINTKAFPSNDNARGVSDVNFLKIDFNSLNSALVDSDYIEIRYTFDNWATYETYMMQNAGYNKWESQLYPPSGINNISFNFNNGTKTDDNLGANWEWDFAKDKYFNFGYERNLVKREYISLPKYEDSSEEDYTWSIEVENGIYDISVLLEKNEKNKNDKIEINGKIYIIDKSYKEYFEIRERILVFDKKIYVKNAGDFPLNIYSVLINRNKKLIGTQIIKPNIFEFDSLFSNEQIEDEEVIFEEDNEIIKSQFTLENITQNFKYELAFDAVSNNNSNKLYLSTSKGFNNNDLIAVLNLTNDLKEYSIDISPYINEIISNNNQFTVFIKGNKGTKILTHKNEIAPFIIKPYIIIDNEFELYQATGIITFNGSNYNFTEQYSNESYISYSDVIDLQEHLDILVMVSGYISEDKLYILKVDPVLIISRIEGDTYTNNQPLSWNVYSDQPLTHLSYRIKGVVEWKTIPYGTIFQEVPDDGEYILEVIPMMNGYRGMPFSFPFIVDRTGPQLTVTENIPEYTNQTEFEIEVEYNDNYTPVEEITTFYRINQGDEIELQIIDGKTKLIFSEGILNLEIYCKDALGNIGNIYSKKVTVDLTKPTLEIKLSNQLKPGSTTNERVILVDFFKEDNLTATDDLIAYFNINNSGVWESTTHYNYFFDCNNFEDGVYPFESYVVDRGGLQSDIVSSNFTVDTIPIPRPDDYDVKIDKGQLVLTWTSRNDDPTFAYYRIRRSPEFNIKHNNNFIFHTNNEFKDVYSLFNSDYKYYISVVDIYGNISDELECSAIKAQKLTGNTGEIKTAVFEDSSISIKFEKSETIEVGVLKHNMGLNPHVKADYKFIEDKMYLIGPGEPTFKFPVIWEIDIGDLTGDIAEKKDDLSLYYYNKVDNYWEEVETSYNEQNDKLVAKLYHFSDYGIGVKKENNISESSLIASIAPTDGSLNTTLDLFTISSHQENYDIKLNFSSKTFNNISKFIMSNYLKDNREIKCEYKAKLTDWSFDKIQHVAQELQNMTENKNYAIIPGGFDEDRVLGEEETTILKYNDYIQEINNLDNAWDINIPKLIKEKPDSTNFKFIEFEDGSSFELKPRNKEYKNIIGKRFIYKELDNNEYLVKSELYKNYKFNSKGNIEYIFYANNAEDIINDIDSYKNKIIFRFNYNENNFLTEIISLDKLGNEKYKITFDYLDIKDIDNPTNQKFMKRISTITKQINIDGIYKNLIQANFHYKNIPISSSISNSYLLIYNQLNNTDNESLVINYERLNRVDFNFYDYEENIIEDKTIIIDYECDGDEYKIIDDDNTDFPFKGQKNIEITIPFYKMDLGGNTWNYRNITMNLSVDYIDVKLKENHTIKTLSKVIIDQKKDQKVYTFDSYQRTKDWVILGSHIINFCKKHIIYFKDKNENIINNSALVSYFHYKKNTKIGLSPFEKSIKIIEDKKYYLTERENSNNIEDRNFDLIKENSSNKYIFQESNLNGIYGINSSRDGVFYFNYDYDSFNNIYYPVEDDNNTSSLEDIIDSNLAYKKEITQISGDNKVIGNIKKVKQINSDNEKILINERYEYDHDKLMRKYNYLNDSERKITKYNYRELGEYFGNIKEDEEFLFTQVDNIEEEIDDDIFKIHKNYYNQSATGEVLVEKTEDYLSNNTSNRYIKEMEYDEFNRIIKEVEVIREVEDAFNLKGRTTEKSYDNLNNIIETKVSGTTKILDSGNIIDGKLSIIQKDYIDKIMNKVIINEKYEDGNYGNRVINIYFYNVYKKLYKSVTMFYENNLLIENAKVKISYVNENFKNDLLITGSYTKIEDSSIYISYYNDVLNNNNNNFKFQQIDLNNYKNEIQILANNEFDYKKASIDFINANQIIHYLGYSLLSETFNTKVNKDNTKEIYKRFITFKVDSNGKILNKKMDEISNYANYEWEYDELGNIEIERYPDNYLSEKKYSTIYYDYFKDIVIEEKGFSKLKKYNNLNSIFYEKYTTEDNSINYEMFSEFNKSGQLKRKIGINGVIEELEYNYYGPIKRTIDNPNDNIAKKNIEVNVYNKIGKSIYSYSDILINSSTFDPNNDWISKSYFDDFGNLIKTESKPDIDILKDNIAPTNLINETIYNGVGKIIFETSNKYKLNTNPNDDKLDDIEYKYTYNGLIREKVYYNWNPKDSCLITFKETYKYDKYNRLENKLIEYKNGNNSWELLSNIIIDEIDQNGNVLKAYSKEKGKNWIETINKYGEDSNLLLSKASVTNISTDIFSTPTNYLFFQKKYILYDNYQRKIAEVDFDKSAQYIEYNNHGYIKKVYKGLNFDYDIIEDTISNISLKSSLIYEYNDGGLKISEKVLDFNTNEVLYEKYFNYDKYGRLISESLNRYNGNIQKNKNYIYDSIGRIKTTVTDEITETIIQWEDESNPRITQINLNDGIEQISFTNSVKYSLFGNIVETVDRDNYKYYSKYDLFGNLLESRKEKNSENILYSTLTYDETSSFLLSTQITSPDSLNMINKLIEYQYDSEGRQELITTYDLSADLISKNEISKKFFSFTESNQIDKVYYYAEEEYIGNIDYDYNDFGGLEKIIYPDGAEQSFIYDDIIKNGKLNEVMFKTNLNQHSIIRDIGYLDNTSLINSYTNGANINTSFYYDPLNRIKAKHFTNMSNGYNFNQIYKYDKSGNIIKIEENKNAGSIIEKTFNRVFKYDEYNRLTNAEYIGDFTHEIKPKLTYQNFDYYPKVDNISYDNLTYDNENIVNIESCSPSILISDSTGNEQEMTPEIIRIYKNANSQLKDIMISPFYQDGDIFVELQNSNYTIENNEEYFEIKNWNIDLTKIIKLNFDLDNSNIDNNPVIDNSLDKKLGDIIKFYTKVDNINLEYTYDVMGNRLTKEENLVKSSTGAVLESSSESYIYDNNKRLLLEDSLFTYEYDLNGQLIKKIFKNDINKFWQYFWDNNGSLRKIIRYNNGIEQFKEEYIYDEAGKRIKTITKDYYILYVYDGLKLIYEKKVEGANTTTKDLIYVFDKLQVIYENDNSIFKTPNYYYSDILDSTRFITNWSGNVIQENIFTPFGIELINSNKSNFNKLHYQYATHHYQNDETGLTYMMGRWMDNKIGRFISSDPTKDGLNYYVYAGNNPTTFIDPSGCYWVISIVLDALAGGFLGGNIMYNYTTDAKYSIESMGGAFPDSWIVLGTILGTIVGLHIGATSIVLVTIIYKWTSGDKQVPLLEAGYQTIYEGRMFNWVEKILNISEKVKSVAHGDVEGLYNDGFSVGFGVSFSIDSKSDKYTEPTSSESDPDDKDKVDNINISDDTKEDNENPIEEIDKKIEEIEEKDDNGEYLNDNPYYEEKDIIQEEIDRINEKATELGLAVDSELSTGGIRLERYLGLFNRSEKFILSLLKLSAPIRKKDMSRPSPYNGIFIKKGGVYGYSDWRRSEILGSSGWHFGLDFTIIKGTNVYSAGIGGKVVKVGYNDVYGNYVIISHGAGIKTLYAHLDTVNVKKNQIVSSWRIIGTVGETGNATGPHLHFAVFVKNTTYLTIDPKIVLNQKYYNKFL